MSVVPTTASLGIAPSWDGEGRRVGGGALAGDPPAPEGEDQLSFGDFLSVINPLQHIPVVSTVYRWLTGDTIKPAARVIGGALYGGPIGLATAAINAIVEQVKGGDLGSQLLAAVVPESAEPTKPVNVTAAAPEAAQSSVIDAAAANKAALSQLAADLRGSGDSAPAKRPETSTTPLIQPGQGRTLAFYQANAGHKLAPVVDSSRGASLQRNTVSSIPPVASSTVRTAPKAIVDNKSETPAQASDTSEPPAAWFAATMLHGLDRYRAAQQLEKSDPKFDVSH